MITLTDAQRKLFASYCYQEAEQCVGLAKQFDDLGGPVGEKMAKRRRDMSAAFALVGAEVDPASWERETIS